MVDVGGYRLVRKLGAGTRAEVYLGGSVPSSAAPDKTPRAIKLYRPGVPDSDINREMDQLTRVASSHIVALHDVATASDGRPSLLLTPVGLRRLSELVVSPVPLAAGEMVTATAPIVRAVASLHEARISHGSIRLANIMFDQRGAPFLVGFGRAKSDGSEGRGAEFEVDLADLASVIRCVLAVSTPPAPRASESLMRLLDSSRGLSDAQSMRWIDEVESRLHDLAEARPVNFDHGRARKPGEEPRSVASLFIGDSRPGTGDPAPARERRDSLESARLHRRPVWLDVIGIPAGLEEVIRQPARDTLGRMRSSLRLVRRRVWVSTAVVGVAALAALVLVPSRGPDPAAAAASRADPSSAVSTPTSSAPGEEPSTVVEAAPAGSAATAGTPADSVQAESLLAGTDAAAAVTELLGVRRRCFETLASACLARVDSTDSASLQNDTRMIALIQSGAETGTYLIGDSGPVALLQSLGSSAILTTTDSHSSGTYTILAVREEGEWRIRDIIQP